MNNPNAVDDRRKDSNGRILCEFCDEPASLQNCWFWPVTQDDGISGPFYLCLAHFREKDDYALSTGDESAMPFPDDLDPPSLPNWRVPMAERNFPIQVVGVEYICDECGIGTMEPHGEVAWLTNPVQYPHRCTNCGSTIALNERYPLVRHLRVNPNTTTSATPHA